MSVVLAKEGNSSPELVADAELVQGLKEGRTESYKELEKRLHTPQCYGIAMGILKDPEEVKDVLQEAFIRVFRYIDGFKEGKSFDAWLFAVIKNLSLDFARKRSMRKTELYEECLPCCSGFDVRNDATAFFNPRPFGENADVVMECENTRARLVAIVKGLSPEFRDALWKFYMEEKSYKVIAEESGIPEGTVMSRLYHAKKAVRKLLKRDELKEQLAA